MSQTGNATGNKPAAPTAAVPVIPEGQFAAGSLQVIAESREIKLHY